MNKFNYYSLYFAVTEDINKLIPLRKKVNSAFEVAKFVKHLKGKTTKHRKGIIEKKISLLRQRVRKMSRVMIYIKEIQKNPELITNINKKEKITIFQWLHLEEE